jgi:hypothetical protein
MTEGSNSSGLIDLLTFMASSFECLRPAGAAKRAGAATALTTPANRVNEACAVPPKPHREQA